MANEKSYEILRYPYEMIGDKTDYLQIIITDYVASGLAKFTSNDSLARQNSVIGTFGPESKGVKKSKQIILLPMPSNIQDGNSVSYGDDSMNGIAGAALAPITESMGVNLFAPDAGAALLGGLAGLGNIALDPDVRKALSRTLAAEAVNIFGGNVTPQQLLARETGQIFNPNMELLFNSTTLRNFKFSFKMTPRNSTESEKIKQIIRSLKRNMAPEYVNAKFLKTPKVFELAFKTGAEDHKFLNKFKQCFLTDMAVNYTGENVYATYSDGSPISMIVDLSFKELEPLYEGDYIDSDEQGYSEDIHGGVGY